MKKYRKLNLRKLSIAKLDARLSQGTIKGGTGGNSEFNCGTEGILCQTSGKTRPLITDTNGPNICDPDYTRSVGPCL